MNVVPQRLRAIRTQRGLSRRELADRATVSEKQLQRLEFPEHAPRTIRPDTLARLAAALGVEPEQLTGEPPTQHDAKQVRITASLLPGVRLAYDLVERRYGFTAGQLINAAPLFFTILAEGSLAWRRVGLVELRAFESRLREIGGPRRFRYGYYAREVSEGGALEEQAIQNGKLFDDPLDEDMDQYDLQDEINRNPFADYLATLADELGKPEFVDLDPLGHGRVGGLSDVPGHRVCSEDLARVASLDSDAAYALHAADVRLSEIPDELAGEDKADARRKWIERRLSTESSLWLDARRGTTAGLDHPAGHRTGSETAATEANEDAS